MTALNTKVEQIPLDKHLQSLVAAGQLEEAINVARSVLAPGTGPVLLWKFLANTLRKVGEHEEARNIQMQLVDMLPGDLSLRFDLAETLLMLGEFQRGWREYHYRYSLPHTVRIERKVQMPRWDGSAIPGKTILIFDEQGFGDTFQFLRLMPLVKKISKARVILEISPETLPFAKRIEGIDMIIPRGQLPPQFDVHSEMMSLPMVMGLQMEDFAMPAPYLTADPQLSDTWKKRLEDVPHPRVALVWGGRATPDPKRSIPLSVLEPLAMEGVSLISLQKGEHAAEVKAPPGNMKLLHLGDEIKSFEDTAAILQHVDLLITIDSAPAHLAGGLGIPAWVLLQNSADWRWFYKRDDSPWYPSLRLFRQPKREDWGSVIQNVAAELKKFADKYRG